MSGELQLIINKNYYHEGFVRLTLRHPHEREEVMNYYDQLPEELRLAIRRCEQTRQTDARDAIAALILPLLEDQARLDWLVEHGKVDGGGRGFAYMVWISKDTEDFRDGIDAARAAPGLKEPRP